MHGKNSRWVVRCGSNQKYLPFFNSKATVSLLIKVTLDFLYVTGSVSFNFVHILYSQVTLCLNELISTWGIILRLLILFIFINIFLL